MQGPETPHPDAHPHTLWTEKFVRISKRLKGIYTTCMYHVLMCYQCVLLQSSLLLIHFQRWAAHWSDIDGRDVARSPGRNWMKLAVKQNSLDQYLRNESRYNYNPASMHIQVQNTSSINTCNKRFHLSPLSSGEYILWHVQVESSLAEQNFG